MLCLLVWPEGTTEFHPMLNSSHIGLAAFCAHYDRDIMRSSWVSEVAEMEVWVRAAQYIITASTL